jgi:HK97 family phage portal protein
MSIISKIKEFRRKSVYGLFKSSLVDVDASGKGTGDYLSYNDLSLYLNRAIDKRAEKVSEVEFVLKKGDKIVDQNNPLVKVLNRPNQFHSGAQFWKLFQKYYDLAGAAFIFVERGTELFEKGNVIKSMHLLRPDLVKVNINADGTEIVGYEYNKSAGNVIKYTPQEVLYFFNPDPKSPLHGASLIKAGVYAIESDIQLSRYHANVLKNGGKVDSVFKFKSPQLTNDQLKTLKAQFNEQIAGAEKSGTPLFLGGDADYQRISLSPEELSYLQSKSVTLDDICILTGVPRAILSNVSDVKFANADASVAVFLRETIKPLLKNLVTQLDWKLIPAEYDLDFVDPTPEDVDRKIKILEAGNTVNAMTTNEKRLMLGLEPYKNPEADQIMLPFSLMPMGSERSSSLMQEGMRKSIKDFRHPNADPAIRKQYGEIMDKRLTSRGKKVSTEIEKYFVAQKERVLSHIGGTKVFRKKGIIDDAFNRTLEIKIAKNTLLPLLQEILKEAGKDAMGYVGSEFDFTLSGEIGGWLDKRASLFAEEINETTYGKLVTQFEDSLAEGESREELIGRIESTYEGFTEGRSRVIASTETHGATQKGTIEGYKQGGAPIKIWVSVGDNSVRDSHAAADGEEVPIGHAFSNGLMYPGDARGGADEVVNCRCTI